MNWLTLTIRVPVAFSESLSPVIAELTKTGVQKINNTDGSLTIKAAVYQSPEGEKQREEIMDYLELLKTTNDDFFYRLATEEISEETWKSFWKSLFRPEKVAGNLVIKPVWHDYEPASDEKVIAIDPGTAFGTGTHTSTLLCIEFLNKIITPGMRVIDVGTGSGILALVAAHLGAKEVEALDFHQDAVDAAVENVQRNQQNAVITVKQSDLLDDATIKADIVVANISAAIIKRLLPQLQKTLFSGGYFICSGLSYDQKEEMTEAIGEAGLEILEITESGTWIAFLAKRK